MTMVTVTIVTQAILGNDPRRNVRQRRRRDRLHAIRLRDVCGFSRWRLSPEQDDHYSLLNSACGSSSALWSPLRDGIFDMNLVVQHGLRPIGSMLSSP